MESCCPLKLSAASSLITGVPEAAVHLIPLPHTVWCDSSLEAWPVRASKVRLYLLPHIPVLTLQKKVHSPLDYSWKRGRMKKANQKKLQVVKLSLHSITRSGLGWWSKRASTPHWLEPMSKIQIVQRYLQITSNILKVFDGGKSNTSRSKTVM
jgi:hypothetical protein